MVMAVAYLKKAVLTLTEDLIKIEKLWMWIASNSDYQAPPKYNSITLLFKEPDW